MTIDTASPRTDLQLWVQESLDDIEPGQFLLVEYLSEAGLPVDPYAQAALSPGGWRCEVVSGHYLPEHRWSLDASVLARQGWRRPDAQTANWWRPDVPLTDAAALLVDALWLGRACTDPDRYAISVCAFPAVSEGARPAPAPRVQPLPA